MTSCLLPIFHESLVLSFQKFFLLLALSFQKFFLSKIYSIKRKSFPFWLYSSSMGSNLCHFLWNPGPTKCFAKDHRPPHSAKDDRTPWVPPRLRLGTWGLSSPFSGHEYVYPRLQTTISNILPAKWLVHYGNEWGTVQKRWAEPQAHLNLEPARRRQGGIPNGQIIPFMYWQMIKPFHSYHDLFWAHCLHLWTASVKCCLEMDYLPLDPMESLLES